MIEVKLYENGDLGFEEVTPERKNIQKVLDLLKRNGVAVFEYVDGDEQGKEVADGLELLSQIRFDFFCFPNCETMPGVKRIIYITRANFCKCRIYNRQA